MEAIFYCRRNSHVNAFFSNLFLYKLLGYAVSLNVLVEIQVNLL